MSGIREIICDCYADAINGVVNNLPKWVYTLGIHPEDRGKYPGTPVEQFIQGARIVEIGDEGKVVITARECVDRVINTAPRALLRKFVHGVQDNRDNEEFCQYARFGEIKYPIEVDEEVPRDAQSA